MAASSSNSPFQFTFSCPAPWTESSGQSNSETLCHECAQLDLEEGFQKAFELYESSRRGIVRRPLASCRKGNGPVYLRDFYFVTSLGKRLSQPNNCKLCNFLARLTVDPSHGTYKLLAFCSSESYLFEPRKKDVRGKFVRRPWEATARKTTEELKLSDLVEHNVFMAIVPEVAGIPKTGAPLRWFEMDLPRGGSIYRLATPEPSLHRLVLPKEVSAHADLSLARAWLNRCRCHHQGCAPRKPPGAELPGFEVIDCISKKFPPPIVKRPWSERYVALSYVWGPPSGAWPPTIMDAMEVTRRLGERWLWVDRHCIDQNDVELKKMLISKMDAIYEGAEFTIVCAAGNEKEKLPGDARRGLPGVRNTPRTSQPWIELNQPSTKAKGKSAVRFAPGSIGELVGITEDEYDTERTGESEWLDDIRFGLRGKMAFDFGQLLKDQELQQKYDIPRAHLDFFTEMAEDDGWKDKVAEYLELQKELARRIGIPLKELVPYFKRQLAEREGWKMNPKDAESMPIEQRALVSASKPKRPLPAGKIEGKLTLVSSMQDPRTSIKDSQWATRGWTYQEGVLSTRRLVFTEEQVYWECRGMAVCESTELALKVVHEPSGARMADYMLSGIFEDDLHEASELQYGFKPQTKYDAGDHVVTLDGHIRAFPSRNLSNGGDSLEAFLGVAASYTTDAGLYLLLGLPVWAGAFANDQPGLQHTFALSLSSWTHVGEKLGPDGDIYVADCPRRDQLPSWTWAGWQGTAEFCNEKQSITHRTETSNGLVGVVTMLPGPPKMPGQDGEFETAAIDPSHSDFFKALTEKSWVRCMKKMWSAEMRMHTIDEIYSAPLTGWTPTRSIGDPTMAWLLTIKKPLVLRHMHLVRSPIEGEKRRLAGKIVTAHLSIPISEAQLLEAHAIGDIVVVLVFASMIPFIYNGIARFLVLRRAEVDGWWERIGRMNMWLTERELNTLKTPEELVGALPVRPFGDDITIV